MKNLLFTILIMFSLGVSGQVDSVRIIQGDDIFYIPMLNRQNAFKDNIKDQSEIQLLYLLTEYSAECDSTYMGRWPIFDYTDKPKGYDPSYFIIGNDTIFGDWEPIGYEETYKKNPTFTGFIEWLRERQR